jgi:hypothetical protein
VCECACACLFVGARENVSYRKFVHFSHCKCSHRGRKKSRRIFFASKYKKPYNFCFGTDEVINIWDCERLFSVHFKVGVEVIRNVIRAPILGILADIPKKETYILIKLPISEK